MGGKWNWGYPILDIAILMMDFMTQMGLLEGLSV